MVPNGTYSFGMEISLGNHFQAPENNSFLDFREFEREIGLILISDNSGASRLPGIERYRRVEKNPTALSQQKEEAFGLWWL